MNYKLAKLQRIQNVGCRIMYNLRKYDHITEHIRDLHWLWAPERITYKVALLMSKVLNDLAPSYLSRLPSTAQYEGRNIKPIFCRTLQALNSFFTATEPRTWIILPNNLKLGETLQNSRRN